MAIITPLKKIFNWQTASEKIPYKVYTAYITVDDSENMYASQILENTIGAVTFEKRNTGVWRITFPYSVPRLKIIIPGFGDWWNENNGITPTLTTTNNYSLTMYPGFGINDGPCNTTNCNTNNIEIRTFDLGVGSIPWRTFFNSPSTGNATSYPIEIRVYN